MTDNPTPTTADVPLTEATATLMDKIEKANRKARNVGLATFMLVAVLIAIGVVGIWRQNVTLNLVKKQQEQNNAATIQARQANADRQDSLKNYIKCLSLLRFDSPEVIQKDVTRQQVSDALDKCAKTTR